MSAHTFSSGDVIIYRNERYTVLRYYPRRQEVMFMGHYQRCFVSALECRRYRTLEQMQEDATRAAAKSCIRKEKQRLRSDRNSEAKNAARQAQRAAAQEQRRLNRAHKIVLEPHPLKAELEALDTPAPT